MKQGIALKKKTTYKITCRKNLNFMELGWHAAASLDFGDCVIYFSVLKGKYLKGKPVPFS